MIRSAFPVLSVLVIAACSSPPQRLPQYDLVIRNGTVYDGNGGAGVNGVPLLLDGEHTGATPGRAIRKRPAAR